MTLERFWSDYFTKEKSHLEKCYSGISSFVFLRFISDYFSLELSAPLVSVGRKACDELEEYLSIGKPLEFLLKESYFAFHLWQLDDSTLIPRNETEGLVELASEYLKNKKCLLDIGCGSGVVGLSLLSRSSSLEKVILSDISSRALKLAKKNYFFHQNAFSPDCQVGFIQSDRFNQLEGKFDLIVSNPPYIPLSQKESVHSMVDLYEAPSALYLADEDYYSWFEVLFQGVEKFLNKGGVFLMEGHEDKLLELSSFHPLMKVKKDLTGRDRYLIWELKP